jgi:6-phosphogluconolactonase
VEKTMDIQRYYDVYIGTYSPSDKEGIHLYEFDSFKGSLTKVSTFLGIDNPSFLFVDPKQNRLFSVSETDNGSVVSFRVDPLSGVIEEINRQPSHGDYPCHLHMDSSGNWLLLVNYMSGSVCVYPVDAYGRIGDLADQIHHCGGVGVVSDRQEGPHPHSVFPITKTPYWLVPDLGNDAIYTYRLDQERGKLNLQSKTMTPIGSGPRHLAFHPFEPFVYVIEELSSSISVYQLVRNNGELKRIQTLSTLPEGFSDESTCAEVAISADGKFLYGSNRGHDSIVSFRVLKDGRLAKLGHTSSAGKTPRNFILIPGGEWLLAANQDSNSIIVMGIDKDGMFTSVNHRYEVASPVCLKIVPRETTRIR